MPYHRHLATRMHLTTQKLNDVLRFRYVQGKGLCYHCLFTFASRDLVDVGDISPVFTLRTYCTTCVKLL